MQSPFEPTICIPILSKQTHIFFTSTPSFSSLLLSSVCHLLKNQIRLLICGSESSMATATASTLSPATLAVATASSGQFSRRRINRVNYLNGLNSFSGLKADNSVASLGLPVCTDRSFAKIVSSLRNQGRRAGGGALSSTCNAVGEIFTIAAIINGLVLVGVAVGFVLLRIEASVEEAAEAE